MHRCILGGLQRRTYHAGLLFTRRLHEFGRGIGQGHDCKADEEPGQQAQKIQYTEFSELLISYFPGIGKFQKVKKFGETFRFL